MKHVWREGRREGKGAQLCQAGKRKGETEGKEKRYRDTSLYAIHPANIYQAYQEHQAWQWRKWNNNPEHPGSEKGTKSL